jgi:hypothetical protein
MLINENEEQHFYLHAAAIDEEFLSRRGLRLNRLCISTWA